MAINQSSLNDNNMDHMEVKKKRRKGILEYGENTFSYPVRSGSGSKKKMTRPVKNRNLR